MADRLFNMGFLKPKIEHYYEVYTDMLITYIFIYLYMKIYVISISDICITKKNISLPLFSRKYIQVP